MTATTSAATRATRRELLAGHTQPEDFRHRAACRSVDPEVFFPAAVHGAEFEQQVSIAKAVCAGCPVRERCLSWALSALPEGIAGGMTEHERRSERARLRTPRRPRPLVARRPAGGSREEVAAAGRAAIAAGLSVREAAGVFLVSERTAGRWAREVRTSTSGGGPGCNQAPHQISHTNPLAGTRAEGHRG
jgi:hypothetical protein